MSSVSNLLQITKDYPLIGFGIILVVFGIVVELIFELLLYFMLIPNANFRIFTWSAIFIGGCLIIYQFITMGKAGGHRQ